MNADAAQACRHEAIHAVTCYTLKRRVYAVRRNAHTAGGETLWKAIGVDPFDAALIALVPFLDNDTGCKGDLSKVTELGEAGLELLPVWEAAHRLLENPEFRRRVRAVEGALMEHPVMTGEEVALTIAWSDEAALNEKERS